MATKKALPARGQRAATNRASTAMSSAAQERKWQAESDLRTLKSAAEIQADKSRVKAAQNEAQNQMRALQNVTKGK